MDMNAPARFFRRALVTTVALALVAACPAIASSSSGARSATALARASGRLVGVSASSSRPLCASRWQLRGNRRRGYICARNGHRRRPGCGAQYQLTARRHGYVCLRRVIASPTPPAPPASTPPTTQAPGPPSPTATPAMEQVLINGAFELAKQVGEKELAEAFYTHVYSWKIEANGCALIAQNTAECVLLLYKEVEVLSYDPSSVVNEWRKAIYLLGVYYEYDGPELGYRSRLGQIGDWAVGPWKYL
jgi:hypothetical protein